MLTQIALVARFAVVPSEIVCEALPFGLECWTKNRRKKKQTNKLALLELNGFFCHGIYKSLNQVSVIIIIRKSTTGIKYFQGNCAFPKVSMYFCHGCLLTDSYMRLTRLLKDGFSSGLTAIMTR